MHAHAHTRTHAPYSSGMLSLLLAATLLCRRSLARTSANSAIVSARSRSARSARALAAETFFSRSVIRRSAAATRTVKLRFWRASLCARAHA